MSAILMSIMTLFVSAASAQIVDRVLVVVNSEIVLESDLKRFEQKLAKGEIIDDLFLFGQKSDALKGQKKLMIDYLVHERILESEIKRLNLSVTSEKIDQEIRDIAKKNNMSKSDLMAAVKAQGMNASDYQDFVKTRIERQSLIEQEISSKIRVSDEEVMAEYIRTNPQAQTGTYEYQLAHILFNPRKGGAPAAKGRAEEVLKKVRAPGANFELLAEQHSEDANFSNGGILGTFKAGEFSTEMEKAVQGLEVGQVSNVVQTKAGFHLIKVLSKKIVTDPKYNAEKERIRSILFEKAFQKHFKNWLEAKKEESFIRVN